MTAVLTILKLTWPYVLCAILAGYLTYRWDLVRYDALQTGLASYKAQEADKDAAAQKVATDALEAQITSRLATEANNGNVIAQLQNERDGAITDRNFARRLLAAAQAQPAAPSSDLPATPGGPGADGGATASGDRQTSQLVGLIGDSATECRIAIQRLQALQLELAPQLRSP